MQNPSDIERIVKLETNQEFQHNFNQAVLAQLGSIEKEVRVISDWIQKKTGFIGGVVFCCSVLSAVIGASASYVWGIFHK